MKPSELKISISVKSYDEKSAENYRNCYVVEKSIISKLSKVSQILIAQIEDLNEDGVQISRSYILYFVIYKPSKSDTVGSGRLIVLND